MDMKLIKNIAFERIGNKSSHEFKEKGNKFYHGERVAALAIKLKELILPDDNSHDEIITVAAWFHDIMNGIDNHATKGAIKTKEILSPYCTSTEISEICEIISVHDDRYSGRDNFSAYIKLHQDADHLDHFGTFDVWMSFIYAVPHNQTINDVKDWLLKVRPAENEKYRNELNFELSRQIFDEKMEFLNYFSNRFGVEIAGGIWNESQFHQKSQRAE